MDDFEWKVAKLANKLMEDDPEFPGNYKEGTTEEYYVKARQALQRILQGEAAEQVENLDTEV